MKVSMMGKRTSRFIPFAVMLIVLIAVGLVFFDDYGQSWDEYFNVEAGRRAFEAYRSGSFLRDQGEDYYHGTFYFMLFYIIPRGLHSLHSAWLEADLRHLINFSTYLLAVIALHSVGRKFLGRRIASIAVLLFISQPLFFGHAFINQKDMPFLAAFLVSIASGLAVFQSTQDGVDRPGKDRSSVKSFPVFDWFSDLWRRSSTRIKLQFVTIGVISTLLLVDLIFPFILLPFAESVLEKAYSGQAHGIIQSVFDALATDSYKTSIDLYNEKLAGLIFWSESLLLALSLALLLYRATKTGNELGRNKVVVREWMAVIFAGWTLGIAISVRIFGVFAGLLVTVFGLIRHKKHDLRIWLPYWGIAILTTYLAWPALWGDPLAAFSTRVSQSINFEAHNVLYQGALYPSTDLPWSYVLSLLIRQLSEPLLLGLIFGLFQLARTGSRSRSDLAFPIILGLWFGIPVGAQVIFGFSIYGNFRQLLFITVPVFFLSAVGWDSVLSKLRGPVSTTGLVGIILLPFIYHVATFHPYEYVYYNQISGGVTRAQGKFLLDYWCTSYREAIEWLNTAADEASLVRVYGPDLNPRTYGREDLIIVADWEPSDLPPEYSMLCTSIYPTPGISDAQSLVKSISRRGVDLTQIFKH
jgi:hypothetical protein